MSAPKWLGTLLDAVFGAVSRFSRKSPPVKPEPFGRKHMTNVYGYCIYCETPKASEREQCPGPK